MMDNEVDFIRSDNVTDVIPALNQRHSGLEH
jgi:hypothetical protein